MIKITYLSTLKLFKTFLSNFETKIGHFKRIGLNFRKLSIFNFKGFVKASKNVSNNYYYQEVRAVGYRIKNKNRFTN